MKFTILLNLAGYPTHVVLGLYIYICLAYYCTFLIRDRVYIVQILYFKHPITSGLIYILELHYYPNLLWRPIWLQRVWVRCITISLANEVELFIIFYLCISILVSNHFWWNCQIVSEPGNYQSGKWWKSICIFAYYINSFHNNEVITFRHQWTKGHKLHV